MPSPRSNRAGAASALLVTTFAACPTGALANVYGAWSSNSNFYWRVTGMTDLDQRRSPGGAPGFLRPGLPNNGAMYCAPTSALNVACYVAAHGYPFIPPGLGNWWSSANVWYNAITSNINLLGALMGTDPSTPDGGTGGSGNYLGTFVWFNSYYFDVVRKSRADFYSPTVNEIGMMGLQGGLTNFAYGRWDFHSAGGNLYLDSREGGHVCTANRVDISGNSILFKYRDPADSPADDGQSPFVNKVLYPTNRVFYRNGLPVLMTDLNVNAGDGLKRLIDSTTSIFPRYGLTNLAGEDGAAQSLRIIIPQPLRPLVGVQTKTFPVPASVGAILDVAVSPDRLHYLFLADDFEGDGIGFTSGLFRLDPFSGEVTRLMGITNPRRMAFSRFPNELFVAETRTLHKLDLSTTPPTIVQQHTVAAGLAIDALAFVPGTDEVLALSGFDDVILRYRRNTIGTEPPAMDNLPAGATFLAGKMFMDVSSADGSVLLACDASNTVARLTRVTDQFSFQSSFTVPSAPRGLHVDDTGQVLVLGDGSVRTYKRIVPAPGGPGAWQEQMTPWSGVAVGPILHITRNSSDDTHDHEGPEYRNLIESEIVGGEPDVPCLGDANQDDVVNFQDLNIVLTEYGGEGMWLEGDVDDDGVVTFADLNTVLTMYGQPCPQ